MLDFLIEKLQAKAQSPTQTSELQAGGGIDPVDAAPEFTLGPQPEFHDPQGLALGMSHVSWLSSRAQTIAARRDQAIRLVRDTAARESQVTVGDETLSCEEYAGRICDGIEEYCDEHDLFESGQKKTWTCPSGTIQQRKRPLSIDVEDPQAFIGRMKESDAFQAVLELAAGIEEFAPYFSLELKIDKAGIKRALQAGQVTADQLAAAGVTAQGLAADDTTLVIKTHAYTQVNVA